MPLRAHHVRPAVAALAAVLGGVAVTGCGGNDAHPPPSRSPSPTASETAPPGAPTSRAGPARTHDSVVRALVGRRIGARGRRIRIERATIACGGIGGAVAHVGGQPAWRRFRCIQPTFPPGSVAGPDLIFTVVSTAPRRLVVEQARLTSY